MNTITRRLLIIGLLIYLGNISYSEAAQPTKSNDLQDDNYFSVHPLNVFCPDYEKSYNVNPYIQAAAHLQAMSQSAAFKCLAEWTKDAHSATDKDSQIALLCLMLFDPDPKYQSSANLDPRFKSGDSNHLPAIDRLHGNNLRQIPAEEFPNYPFIFSDGVPFLVTYPTRFPNGRGPPSSAAYLAYCVKFAKWSNRKYADMDEKHIGQALDKLLQSSLYRARLKEGESNFFKNQIKDVVSTAGQLKADRFTLTGASIVFGYPLTGSFTDLFHYYQVPIIDSIKMAAKDMKKTVAFEADLKSEVLANFEMCDVPQDMAENEFIKYINSNTGFIMEKTVDSGWKVKSKSWFDAIK